MATALRFVLDGCSGRARACTLGLPHGDVLSPVFMPVGTKGTMKGLTSAQLAEVPHAPRIILSNTYHLALQPGTEVVDQLGGLHSFMNWPRNLLTDSGGFQMVSLLELAHITEEGVRFRSPVDGSEMLLTPEQSIRHQMRIGADIMMALDDVVSSVSDDPERFEEATHRTLRWIDRCIATHTNTERQSLFGIVQGGLDVSEGGLRDVCIDGLIERNLPGYAIGGLAGGEDKESFWRVVEKCTRRLPADKPRYLMGVGYPLDIVVCVALGVDMFDCVYPTRTARFGVALVGSSSLRLKSKEFATQDDPIDSACSCLCCTRYSRSAVHRMLKERDSIAPHVLTIHNIAYMMRLLHDIRESILAQTFPDYVREFLRAAFPDGSIPQWVCDALEAAQISVHRQEQPQQQQAEEQGEVREEASAAPSLPQLQQHELQQQHEQQQRR